MSASIFTLFLKTMFIVSYCSLWLFWVRALLFSYECFLMLCNTSVHTDWWSTFLISHWAHFLFSFIRSWAVAVFRYGAFNWLRQMHQMGFIVRDFALVCFATRVLIMLVYNQYWTYSSTYGMSERLRRMHYICVHASLLSIYICEVPFVPSKCEVQQRTSLVEHLPRA